MAKYLVTQLLWSPSQSRYIQPGEEVELEKEIALILLRKNHIKPAVYQQAEENHGTNRRSNVRSQRKDRGIG